MNTDRVRARKRARRRELEAEIAAQRTAVVLPVGACAAEFRWFDALGWRPIPVQTKGCLTAPDHASFNETATAAYERFQDMAVAGIAFHF
jgi:hypothetical protein